MYLVLTKCIPLVQLDVIMVIQQYTYIYRIPNAQHSQTVTRQTACDTYSWSPSSMNPKSSFADMA